MAKHSLASQPGATLSLHPYLGILAVLLGGTISVLDIRLLSLGLADIRGALGLSIDEAAWIPAAYNMSLMFIGPFSVYLGGILGARRVLLCACVIYCISSFLTPFASSYSAMIVLQVLAGLSSGTFYPLTLSFILLNLPLTLTHFGLAAYAIAILFGLNFGSSLDAWLMNVTSWRGIFWNSAVMALLIFVCVYFGMPKQLLPRGKKMPSWRGFFYWSLGLALIYGAIDQGARLNWFDSGIYAGLLASGIFLILTAFVRRLVDPNPAVSIAFLLQRNILILGAVLFVFRISILTSTLLIPQYLQNVPGLKDEQIGPVLSIIALLQLGLGWASGMLIRSVNSLLLLSVGLATSAVGAFFCAKLTTEWTASSFIPFAVVFAFGQSFSLVGLVGSIVLEVVGTGAVSREGKASRPFDVLTFSGFFHTVRLMGGEVGTVLLVHLITDRTKYHFNILAQQTSPARPPVGHAVAQASSLFLHSSTDRTQIIAQSGSLLGSDVGQQAYSLAISDGFLFVTFFCGLILLAVAFVRQPLTRFEEVA